MRNQYVSIAISFMFHCVLYSQNKDSYRNINWRVFHTAKIADQIDVHSETWKNLSMHEKIDLFQIPTGELEKMTTMELLNAYEDCAFARDRFLFPDMDQYFDYVYKLFNGSRELLNRPDLVESII